MEVAKVRCTVGRMNARRVRAGAALRRNMVVDVVVVVEADRRWVSVEVLSGVKLDKDVSPVPASFELS